jgi:hypothetical protein
MPRPLNRSISVPIVLSVIAVLLTVAMLVGWVWVLRENLSLTRALWANRWLLAGGIVSFAVIVAVLVLFSVSLVRKPSSTRSRMSSRVRWRPSSCVLIRCRVVGYRHRNARSCGR